MSAHLQFGPEWMRKGPGKTGSTSGASGTSDSASTPQDQPLPSASTTTGSTTTGTKSSTTTGNRRNPSLGNLSASVASIGTSAPLTPAVTTPSPGAFSFAAAAQGGSSLSGSGNATSTSSSTIAPSSDIDSAKYSKRLLSLYSSERGGKGSAPTQTEAQCPPSPGSGLKKKSSTGSSVGPTSSDRESRRAANTGVEGFGQPRTLSPNGEPRGLNARTISLSTDKPVAHRPGLFQRGSSYTNTPPTALSPTLFQSSRERDRFGTGIQGGVLSGVAAIPSARRRKDSETGADSLRSPRAPLDAEHQWEQRRTNDAFTSARNRSSRTVHDEGTGVGASSGTTEMIETWSRFGGRRERAPGEGPIGPPADHSGGFAKFAGYDRKRERQASMAGPKRLTEPSDGSEQKKEEDELSRDGGQGSSDVDLSKHATYVLDSLQLDDDDEEEDEGRVVKERTAVDQQESYRSFPLPEWSPETQDWLYRDLSGLVQGPFKANLMQDWYAGDYFSSDLLIRRAEEKEFQTLAETLMVIGDAVNPFLVPPSAYARPMAINKVEPVYEQPTPAGFHQDQSSMFLNQNQQQANNPVNALGWPGNLDLLNHFGAGVNSGHSSPFATPQGNYAELDGGHRLRPRTQQEQCAEMVRQKELADQRAFHEQRAAQMAAIAMAQAQGRDPAMLGLWGSGSMMGGEWNQAQSQANFDHGDGQHPLSQQQQQQQQVDPYGQGMQIPWDNRQYNSAQGLQEQQQEQFLTREAAPQNEHYEAQIQPETSHQQQEANGHKELISEQEHLPENVGDSVEQTEEENVAAATSMQDSMLNAEMKGDEATLAVEEEKEEEKEEQAPEEVWPQSPTAVEFASEPLMTEEQWSKEEFQSKGKKSRRDKAKQKVDDDAKQDQANTGYTRVGSGNVRTMEEEQFRRNQGNGRDASPASQAPLSSWLPDASGGGGTPTKAAPWANSQQDGNAFGHSLREIQEAESRQAEARKAARQLRLQTNNTSSSSLVPSSGGGDSALPTTMSWGLASSIPHSTNGKDGGIVGNNAVPSPAWNARQAPKKTLMEIQEEERKRAQKLKDMQTAQTAAKSKGYADSASKLQINTAPSTASNSNWSLVGASGKPNSSVSSANNSSINRSGKAVNATAAAPSLAQRSVSSSSTGNQVWSNGSSSIVPNNGPSSKAAATITLKKAGNQTNGGSDSVPTPSADFIRHCKDQLKGLNVKVDDFIEMLLSFPLDPSPDVIEIIAESVYASSSTLDGRRFASDFVAKRKLDAAQSRGTLSAMAGKGSGTNQNFANGGQTSASPLRSASDVLRSTPSNDGFGGFKVVKAKGTKKRA